jgi:hypothetical protein
MVQQIKMSTVPVMQNLKSFLFGGASAVDNPDIITSIEMVVNRAPITKWLADTDIHNQFLEQYTKWILDTKRNKITGLDEFDIAVFSQGTSESFDKFYLKNSTRRFRCFRGEYMYHAASWRNYFSNNWCYLDQDDIQPNDAVIISLPFSDTGNKHVDMDRVLERCTQLGVPVLVDCAFFGICQNIDFDFSWPCITDITFSLSKTMPISHARIGMRLTKIDDDDSLLVHHKTQYINRLSCGIGIEMLKLYSADYNCERWESVQQNFCQQLDILPSSTVVFGLDQNKYTQYNRGGPTNRLCFAKYMYTGKLPND